MCKYTEKLSCAQMRTLHAGSTKTCNHCSPARRCSYLPQHSLVDSLVDSPAA